MANEIDTSTIGDLTLSVALSAIIGLLFADRSELPDHPAFVDVGQIGFSSSVTKVPLVGLNVDEMTAIAEGSSSSNTALSDGSFSLTLGRRQIQRTISGLGEIILPEQLKDLSTFANDFYTAYRRARSKAICVAGAGFSNSSGVSGMPLTVAIFESARDALSDAGVPGPYVAVLYPRQVTDLKTSLQASGGMRQYIEADQDAIDRYGSDYAGRICGVDVWKVAQVPSANSGADSAGFMCGAGAIAHGHAMPGNLGRLVGTILDVDPEGRVVMEMERQGGTDQTVMYARSYFGVVIAQDSLGRKIISRR